MPCDSRIGDIGVGVCCCHSGCIGMSGSLITGASSVIVENSPTSRCGDIVLANCGHIGIMVTCSSTVFSENSGNARIGDIFSGCFNGVLVTGAPTVNIGG